MVILVVTAAGDDTAARVCRALDSLGREHLRIDLGDFPERMSVAATGPVWSGWLSYAGDRVRLSDIESVYYRRPSGFRFPTYLSKQEWRFATAEARQGVGGLLSCLPVPFVNHPSRIADAELKPAQLQAAARLGLRVPSTLITNDAEQVRAFIDATAGPVLYKPLTAAFLYTDDGVALVYATPIGVDDLDAESISLGVCQFQEFVAKRYDVRLIAVGHRCFAASIHAGSEDSYWDWRADYPSLQYEPVEPPADVASSVKAYLEFFGLSFGCFDFTVDSAGGWWFLECGANAQWGWIERETGLPIADTIARELVGEAV